MKPQVKEYYDSLAAHYDQDRFHNSYGHYIDQQERKILNRYLSNLAPDGIIDLACGTGRFMNYCGTGLDLSAEMIAVATNKYPDKIFNLGNALQCGLESNIFEGLICFHLIMHLDSDDLPILLDEAHRISKKGATFIFDLPSKERRQLLKYRAKGWHGANSYTEDEVRIFFGQKWSIINEIGVAFLPIHLFPVWARPFFMAIDNFLCRTFLKRYSSYRVYILENT